MGDRVGSVIRCLLSFGLSFLLMLMVLMMMVMTLSRHGPGFVLLMASMTALAKHPVPYPPRPRIVDGDVLGSLHCVDRN